MVMVSTSILDAAGVPLAGADGELVPRDALASASTAPIHLVADGAGVMRGMLAAGGAYQLRLRDPQGRGGAVTALVATGGLAASYALPHALKLQGRLEVSGSPTPIDRATVQLLCMLCTGVERDRPLAETTSDHGTFLLSVPDPGVP